METPMFALGTEAEQDPICHYGLLICQLAAQASVVTALLGSARIREWSGFLATGGPEQLYIWRSPGDDVKQIHDALSVHSGRTRVISTICYAEPEQITDIPRSDLLVIDTDLCGQRLHDDLRRHGPQAAGRILVYGTAEYGFLGPDGEHGLRIGLRRWLREHEEWSVAWHYPEAGGLTLVSRLEYDRPMLPTHHIATRNMTRHLERFVADGGKGVEAEEHGRRLFICADCPSRNVSHCSIDGMRLEKKAVIRVSECDLGYWRDID